MVGKKKQPWHRAPWILKGIGIFKIVKSILLLIVSLAAFGIEWSAVHKMAQEALERLASSPNGEDPHRTVLVLAERLLTLHPGQLTAVGVGAGVYCVLYMAEGIGLLRDKLWAEWLTITTTAGFIPLELYEIQRHANSSRVAILFLNLVILAYLIYRLGQRHRETMAFRTGQAEASGGVRELQRPAER